MKLHFQQYYWRWLKNFFVLFAMIAFVLSGFRLGFALTFGDFQNLIQHPHDLIKSFWLGLRYDIMPLAYIFALPFLILHLACFLPGKRNIRFVRWLLTTMLTIGLIALMWLYIFDYAFYSYFQEHINVLFFGLFEDDTLAVLQSIWKNYNIPLWSVVIFFSHYGIYKLTRIMFSPYDFDLKRKNHYLKMSIAFVLGSVFLAYAARGTFSRLPLSIEDAHISKDEFINELPLTGALTLNRAIKIRKVFGQGEYNYLTQNGFKNWQEAFEVAFGRKPHSSSIAESLMVKTPINPVLEQRKPHVVMLVMESFGTYWNDLDNVEFDLLGELRTHLADGLYFKNFLPAENGTIGSMVSIATSQVLRPGARFLSESSFMATSLSSAVNRPYQEKGYDTHFIYGGKLGWRNLGKYLAHQKYDHLWGAEEMKEAMPELANFEARDLGNEWGIFDEYLYAFIEEQLRTASKPQFFLVLTTSNHPPFEFPSTYKPLPLSLTPERASRLTISEDLARKRFLALQYANQKAGEFIGRIRKSPLSDQTVISLTGDHSYWIAKGVGGEQEFKRYAVPFYISLPKDLTPARVDLSRFGSHEDMFPTLYHLTLSNQKYVGIGENMLKDETYAQNGSGLVADKNGAYHHEKFWKWRDKDQLILEESQATPELQALKRKSEALISITDEYLKEEKIRKPSVEGNDRP